MANLLKDLLDGVTYDITSGDLEFIIPKVFNLKDFTLEAVFTGVTYPAAEDDAEISIEDSEDGTNYAVVKGNGGGTAREFVDTGNSVKKIRLVDLKTRNIKLRFIQANANGGSLDSLKLTASN